MTFHFVARRSASWRGRRRIKQIYKGCVAVLLLVGLLFALARCKSVKDGGMVCETIGVAAVVGKSASTVVFPIGSGEKEFLICKRCVFNCWSRVKGDVVCGWLAVDSRVVRRQCCVVRWK